MKIIHAADLHLGSKIEAKFSKEKSDIRRREILHSFGRLVDYAKDNDVHIILLSGDVFDKDKPAIKDKEYFYHAIKTNPNIDFLYLNGNHDKEGSYVEEDIPNLKRFNKENFTTYQYDNVAITGIEISPENARSFYAKLSLDKALINIVMLHGEAGDAIGMDKVKINNLKNKGIDYLALGHIHSFKEEKIDERGKWAYSGCLEGRGFDETGEKGFILLDVSDHIESKFIPFASRIIHELDVDVTGSNNLYDIEGKVKLAVEDIPHKDIIRINLVGELPLEAEINEKDVTNALNSYFFNDVKNKTTIKINPEDYKDDSSLIGEFIRGVSANEEYSEEEKQKIISVGLRAIKGRGIEL